MALPYSSATSGEKAAADIQKILRHFGCTKFGVMVDDEAGELLVQFEYRKQPVSVKASYRGYAAAWLKENPWSYRRAGTEVEYEKKALQIGSVAVYSVLRDWIKGQVTAIETGIISFEGAFLGQLMLSNGQTVLQTISSAGLLTLDSEASV